MRPPGFQLDYATKHLEAGLSSAPKPLFEPGALIRCQTADAAGQPSLASSYALDPKPLGRGSYGEVWAATHRKSGARRAVKSIQKAGLKRYVSNVSGFIQREIDCLRRLDHPNICRIYEAYETEEQTDLVLEICEGGDLLERLSLSKPRLPEAEAASLFAQMLGAVQHLFLRGVVHRDLKPENFLFTRREPEREPLPPMTSPVKLIDFGLSRRISSAAQIHMTPKIGTIEYMAPEAYAGNLNSSHAHRADMWSLGVILHIIFLGHFPSPKLVELPPQVYFSNPCFSKVSREGIDLLGLLLRKSPQERPAVNAALSHPWIAAVTRVESPWLGQMASVAMQPWQSSVRLRHLALVAAAREVNDEDACVLRRLFQALELECGGALTRPALERSAARQGQIADAAKELHSQFDTLDIDGSEAIDWTEFLAAALSVNGNFKEIDGVGVREDASSADGQPVASLPRLTDDACWAAFELLSQGSGVVSGASLGQLLAPGEVQSWLERGSHMSFLGLSDQSARCEAKRVAELDRLVREAGCKRTFEC